MFGCSSAGSGASFYAPAERCLATGDWNDIAPAVEAGARAAEMAVVGSTQSDDGRSLTFDLVTVTDEPARLTATTRSARPDNRSPSTTSSAWNAGAGAGPLELSATVGRFGDTKKERTLLRAVRRRLEQLSGVDSSPLPDDLRDLLR